MEAEKRGLLNFYIYSNSIQYNTCVYRSSLRNKQQVSCDKFRVQSYNPGYGPGISESEQVLAGVVTLQGTVI